MNHRLSNYLGAIAAWLCLAPIAFAKQQLSMASTLVPAPSLDHSIVNLSVLMIWISGGTFLIVSGLLAFTPLRCCARSSKPFSRLAGTKSSAEIGLAWTTIPLLVLALFLA